VKTSNYCSNKQRSEERKSQFAICYNLVHDINETAKIDMICEKEKKGQEYEDSTKLRARGTMKISAILKKVKDRHKKIEGLVASNAELKEAFDCISKLTAFSTSNSFKAERQKTYFEKTSEALKKKVKKQNKLERKTGVTFTAAVCEKVRFFDAKANYQDGIKAELRARGCTDFSRFKNFTQLKNELKDLVAKDEGRTLKEIKHFPILSNFDWSNVMG